MATCARMQCDVRHYTGSKVEVNGCHAPRQHPDTQTGVVFLIPFSVFVVCFSPKMLFFYISMTENAFTRAIEMFFAGSQHGVAQQLNQSTTQTRKKTLRCRLVGSAV